MEAKKATRTFGNITIRRALVTIPDTCGSAEKLAITVTRARRLTSNPNLGVGTQALKSVVVIAKMTPQ